MNFIEPNKLVDFDGDVATICFPNSLILHPMQGGIVSVDIRVKIPETHCGMLFETKGAFSKGLTIGSKLIHPGYQGNLELHVRNLSDTVVEFKAGESMVNLCLVATLSPGDYRSNP